MAKTASTNTFAVIGTGGKQYLVTAGDVINVEKLAGEHNVGDTIKLDTVLLTIDGDTVAIGAPHVAGKTMEVKFLGDGKGKKVEVMKYKAKSRYLKKNGHRQPFSRIEILGIK